VPFHTTFPLPDLEWPALQPFWAAAAQGRLVIPRCSSCARWVWYPRPACPACKTPEPEWTPVSGRGRLFTWTVVSHPFLPAFRDKVPLVTGLVALEENPAVRLATELVDCAPEGLACDQPVEVTFRPLRFRGVDGEVVVPVWRPIEDR
jgi:uncharacterized OB-fold protein